MVIPVAVVIALLICVCYMLLPHSFADLQPDCDSVTVFYIDLYEDVSKYVMQETYSADSVKFGQIMDILSDYTYHRSFRTLMGASSMEGNRAGYWIKVNLYHGNDLVDFMCGGTGEISIDGLVWRVGYFGNRASLDMMEKIAVLFKK